MVNVVDRTIPAGLLGEKVALCLIQLQCPFPNEMVTVGAGEYPTLEWRTEALEKRRSRLKNLLHNLRNINRHVEILVLPEYSVSRESAEDLKIFAAENKTITIANYYDVTLRRSITSVILPNGDSYDQQKIIRSRYDTNVLSEIADSEKSLNRFYWSIVANGIDKKVFLQIFTCKDFLSYWAEVVDRKHGGIVLVSMCSPNIDEFVSVGRSLVSTEDIKGRDGSVVTILCNAAGILSDKTESAACGSSQPLGPFRGSLPVLTVNEEQGMIVDIRPLNILKLPSPTTRENEVIESPAIFSISKEGRIVWGEKTVVKPRRKTSLVVCEEALSMLGLVKFYGFARIEDYYRHRPYIKKLPIQCTGIYGFHDILFQSYEENWDMCLQRVHSSLPMSTISALRDIEYLTVSRVLKTRGTSLVDAGDIDASKEYLQEKKAMIRDLLISEEDVDENLKKEFLKRRILTSTALGGVSDISEDEKASGLSEFLVLVFIIDAPFTKKIPEYFEKEVVVKLMSLHSIRTIEYCGTNGSASVERAHYIFHIVGTKEDLQKVVIEGIHKLAWENDIKIGTRLVFPAEDLSSNSFPSLLETETDRKRRKILHLIISRNFGEDDAFAVKRLTPPDIAKICNIYDRANKWFNDRRNQGTAENLIGEWDKYLGRFIYGITYALVKESDQVDPKDRENIWEYCRNFYTRLSVEIELILNSALVLKAHEMDNKFGSGKFEEMLQDIWDKEDKTKHFVKVGSQTVLDPMIKYIIYWNVHATKYGYEDSKIRDSSFTSRVKELHNKKFAQFRNAFSHGRSEGEQYLEIVSNKEDIRKMLSVTEIALDFLVEEIGA